MNILITGGAGYIGYSVVKHLLESAGNVHSITIYDNLSRRNYSFFTEAQFDHKPVKLIQGDILDGRTLLQALKGVDCVVHLAARVTTPYADSEAHSFDQVNHWGTAQLAYAIENSDVSRVIYVSSMSIYGAHDVPLDEAFPPNPQSFYGRSKWDGEKQIQVLQDNRQVFILRSGNVYGYNPSYRIDAVVNKFLFQANFLGRITINGSGDQHRSFIHVDKLADVISRTIDGQVDAGVYNVVEHNFSINEVAGHIQCLYPKVDIIHATHNIRMKDVLTSLPCRIWDHLPKPQVGFEDELLQFKSRFSF